MFNFISEKKCSIHRKILLPPRLATEKNTEEQVEMCFRAHRSEKWEVTFD
ncbi:MAG: hypothetical protein LBH84_06100 [Prevotellaceae bacterium]|jgi:hypothetical protein|nr:hypothetical protein [Prevotellaceae bacterium]